MRLPWCPPRMATNSVWPESRDIVDQRSPVTMCRAREGSCKGLERCKQDSLRGVDGVVCFQKQTPQ